MTANQRVRTTSHSTTVKSEQKTPNNLPAIPRRLNHENFLIMSLLLLNSLSWADGVRWQDLPPSSQQALANLKEGWDSMPAQNNMRLLKQIEQWQSLSDEEKIQAKQRFERWQQLPPEKRQRLMAKYQEFCSLHLNSKNKLNANGVGLKLATRTT